MQFEYEFSISKALAEGRLIPLERLTTQVTLPIPAYISRTLWERPDIRQEERRLCIVLRNHLVTTLPPIEAGECGEFRGTSGNPDSKPPFSPLDWVRVITGIYRVYRTSEGGRFVVITVWDEPIDSYVQTILTSAPEYEM